MKKGDIIIKKENNEFFFKKENIEISFSYDYFNKFIEKYEIGEIIPKELYLDIKDNRFKFNLVSINKINMDEDIYNGKELFYLKLNRDKYLKENMIFLGNNKLETQAYIYFPFYLRNDENVLYNDFLMLVNEDYLKLDEYVSTEPVYDKNGIVICLEL